MEVLIDGVRYIPAPPALADDADLIERVLACPIEYESGRKTIRDYFHELLETLFWNGEGFSPKSPFGNSGWELDLLYALVNAGIISARFDNDGDIIDIPHAEEDKGNALLSQAIDHIFYGKPSEVQTMNATKKCGKGVKPEDIKVGHVYKNKGAGKILREVLDIGEHCRPYGWVLGKGDLPKGVHYVDSNDKQGILHISDFADWCGERVHDIKLTVTED